MEGHCKTLLNPKFVKVRTPRGHILCKILRVWEGVAAWKKRNEVVWENIKKREGKKGENCIKNVVKFHEIASFWFIGLSKNTLYTPVFFLCYPFYLCIAFQVIIM